jgi:hypothetical protein
LPFALLTFDVLIPGIYPKAPKIALHSPGHICHFCNNHYLVHQLRNVLIAWHNASKKTICSRYFSDISVEKSTVEPALSCCSVLKSSARFFNSMFKNISTMKRIIAITFTIMAVTVCPKLFAQKPAVVGSNEPGWTHIGHTTASFKMQNESVVVLGADEFTALKIKVTDAGLHIHHMQVFYESGDMEEINLKDDFNQGTESRTIRLKHPDRDIQKVAFTYKTRPNAKGDKADIDLYGLKTNQPAGKDAYRDEKAEIKEEAREAERKADEIEIEVEEETQSAGDKIEEGAKDAAAAIKDRKLKNKVAPGGETAYVDDSGRYYYISNAGEKVFITRIQLKDKPKD